MLRVRYGNVNRVLTEKKDAADEIGASRKKTTDEVMELSESVEKVENVEERGKNSFGPSPSAAAST
jgi:hypothetical protein